MAVDPELLERELVEDLARLEQRFMDEEFSSDLYRALANNVWRKVGGPAGHLSVSWGRAEEIVNELRAGAGEPPLTLAQTGGEGEVSDLVAGELSRLGWTGQPLNTARHDPQHLGQPESPPPADHGERMAPVEDAGEWERLAHEEADRPARATGGTGAGAEEA
jgi:hypothetical protein